MLIYSKALRCTFIGTRKNPWSSKVVQLELLNRVRAKSSKKRAASLHKFRVSEIALDQIRKRASARSVLLEAI